MHTSISCICTYTRYYFCKNEHVIVFAWTTKSDWQKALKATRALCNPLKVVIPMIFCNTTCMLHSIICDLIHICIQSVKRAWFTLVDCLFCTWKRLQENASMGSKRVESATEGTNLVLKACSRGLTSSLNFHLNQNDFWRGRRRAQVWEKSCSQGETKIVCELRLQSVIFSSGANQTISTQKSEFSVLRNSAQLTITCYLIFHKHMWQFALPLNIFCMLI